MERHDLTELHYITPAANIVSILQKGLLSHKLAARISHQSAAMAEIQQRRKKRVVPGGRPLHEYVNLYICARNPMLYKLQAQHTQLSVLSIHPNVLDLPGTVIADRNASSDHTRFAPAPEGLIHIDKDLVFAEYWIHDDPIEEWRHKSIKCAEVLVPERVPVRFIRSAYVSGESSRKALKLILKQNNLQLKVAVNRHLFFK